MKITHEVYVNTFDQDIVPMGEYRTYKQAEKKARALHETGEYDFVCICTVDDYGNPITELIS